jgi:YD repeat-containing protein
MSRAIWIIIGALLFSPARAQADGRCLEARALRGNVETVLLSQGQLWTDTGAVRGKINLWEKWSISQDRRTATIVQYTDGFALLPWIALWPTTICEFDEAGRLVKSRWKSNGLTTYSTEVTTYDAQGRPVMVKSDDAPDRVLTYEYSGNSVTARHPAHNPITTTTERDSSGRVTRVIRRDETEKIELSNVEYRYGPGTKETIGLENGNTWRYVSTLDALGNTISSSSVPGGAILNTTRFDYDAQGNWIRRVQPLPQLKISRLETRQITYFP